MEFVEVTLNPLMAEFETEATTVDMDAERKIRRYWTPKEEERFHEIWGRENWRLTRYGKNTVFFAKWADELNERWGIDVKPEEIQTKVNQAKAKYRQVMKCMEVEKTNVTKWKKFEIIDRILRNEHRPKDSDPISADAMEKSHDFSPVLASTVITTHQSAAAKAMAKNAEANATHVMLQENHQGLDLNMEDVSATETEPIHTNSLFHNNDSHSTSQYSTDLFNDQIDEIKQEDFHDEFSYENSSLYNQAQMQPQLTQLQTPQQQKYHQQQQQHQQEQQQEEQQQEQQQQYQIQTQSKVPTSHPQQHLQEHIQQLQQEIQQQQQHDHQPQQQHDRQPQQQQQQTQQLQTFDQTLNTYTIPTTSTQSNSRSLLTNNHNQNAPTAAPSVRPAVHSSATNQYANDYVVAPKSASVEANVNKISSTITNSHANAHTIHTTNTHTIHTTNTHTIHTTTNTTNTHTIHTTTNTTNSTNTTNTTNSNSNIYSNNNNMQPPRMNAVASTGISTAQPRKRRASGVHVAGGSSNAATDSLELLYLEEVRKKNLILDEQKEISRKRMLLEERKIALMEQFFPKCLELQQKILQKLNSA